MAIAGQFVMEERRQSIPATMLAAVYRGVNDVRLETVPVPEIGAGELLVRVHSCGVCGTDLKKIATGSHSSGMKLRAWWRRWERECGSSKPANGWSCFITFHVASVTTADTRPSRNAQPTRRLDARRALNPPAGDSPSTSG